MYQTRERIIDNTMARVMAREMLRMGWRPLPDGLIRPPRGSPQLPEPIERKVWEAMCELERSPELQH